MPSHCEYKYQTSRIPIIRISWLICSVILILLTNSAQAVVITPLNYPYNNQTYNNQPSYNNNPALQQYYYLQQQQLLLLQQQRIQHQLQQQREYQEQYQQQKQQAEDAKKLQKALAVCNQNLNQADYNTRTHCQNLKMSQQYHTSLDPADLDALANSNLPASSTSQTTTPLPTTPNSTAGTLPYSPANPP